MNLDLKTTKTLRIMYMIICIILLITTVAIANFWISKQKVYKARGYIPEGVIITKDNFDELFYVDEIPLKDYDKKYYYIAGTKEEIGKNELYGKKIKYSRIFKDRIGPDVVDMTDKDAIAFMLYHWSEKLGTRMVGKYIKLNAEDEVLSKGVRKGIDLVKIKFGRNLKNGGETKYAIGERYIEAPVLEFDNSKGGSQLKGIVVAIPEKISLKFDEERKTSKNIIIEYMAWRNKDIKEEPYKKVIFTDDVDAEYNAGVSYRIGDKTEIDVSKASTAIIEKPTTAAITTNDTTKNIK